MPNDPGTPRLTLTGAGTRVLIVATEEYPVGELAKIDGVIEIAKRLQHAFAARCGVDPANVEVLENPANPDAIAIAFTAAAQQATDTLVFYYIGHGVFNDELTLMLGTKMTTGPTNQRGNAWPVTEIQRISTANGSPRLLVLLDCCNSGRAQSSSLVRDFDQRARGRGMFVLAAAYREAHAAADNQGTVFTAAFIDLLTQGSTHAARWIRVADLAHLMERLLEGRATKRGDPAPAPIPATTGNIGHLILASNVQGPEPTTRLAHLTDLADVEYEGPCPWTDLAPIYATTTAQLFGRDAFIATAISAISQLALSPGLVAIAGASGVGKTSTVHAGLLPAIAAGALTIPKSNLWPQFTMAPGTNPIRTLTTVLATHLSSAEDLNEQLRSAPDHFGSALTRAMREHPAPERIVLVIDQFEEVFNAHVEDNDRALFLRAIIALADGPALVLLCSRADFYGTYLDDPILSHALSPQRQLNLPPMSETELRQVITGPTDSAGMAIEARLADQIINDLREGTRLSSASLPMLSCALAQTWHNRLGSVLTHDGYTKAGGVGGAIAQKADQAYQNLSDQPNVQAAAKRILIALVQFSTPSGPVRQAVTVDNLIVGTNDEQRTASADALESLRGARLVVVDDDTGLARLVHDALVREWGTLAVWISEHEEGSATRDNLIADADKWASPSIARNPSYLYRRDALVIAERFAENYLLGTVAREFLEAAQQQRAQEEEEAERSRRARELEVEKAHSAALRRRARFLIALATAAVLVATAAGFYFVQARAAQQHATALLYTNVATRLVQDAQQLFGRGRDARRAVLEILAAHALAPELTSLALLGAQIHTGNITSMETLERAASHAISDDARWSVVGDYAGGVRVWDNHTSGEPRALPGTGDDTVVGLAISPDGQWIAAGDVYGTVRVWDTHASQGPFFLTGTGSLSVNGLAISPDGRWVAAADYAGSIRVWDRPSGSPPYLLPGTSKAGYDGVAISPDGRWVVAGDLIGQVKVWDRSETASGREPLWLPATANVRVRGVSVSPDGRWVAAGDEAGWVRVWDLQNSAEPRVLPGIGSAAIYRVLLSSDGQRVVAYDVDGTTRIWDLAELRPLPLPDLVPVEDSSTELNPGGRWIAITDKTGEVHVRDSQNTAVSSTALNPGGRWIAITDMTGEVHVWDRLNTARPRPLADTGDAPTPYIAISDEGRVVAGDTGSAGAIRLWDVLTDDAPRTLIRFTHPFTGGLAITGDGRWVTAGDFDGTVRVWDLRVGQEPRTLPGPGKSVVRGVAITPDGRWIVAGDDSGTVRLWDTHSAEDSRVLTGVRNSGVYRIAASSNGKWIASGDAAGVVRLWDTESADEPRNLTGLSAGVLGLAISPDGRWIVGSDYNDGLRIWSTDANQIGVASADQNVGSLWDFGFDFANHFIHALSYSGIVFVPFSAPDAKVLCAKLIQPMSQQEWSEWVSPDIPWRPVCENQPTTDN